MSSRYIPQPLKRDVRKEAHFGCVLCGSPIIEFHHIQPFHQVKEHTKENLVPLCPEHHHRADCSEIPVSKIESAKNNPFNKNKEFISKDFFLSSYTDLRMRVGSNVYIRTPKILVIDDFPLITVTADEEDNALLNAEFYNSSNVLLAEIIDNEWRAFKNPEFWDISYSPGHLKINRNKGDIFLELKLNNGDVDLRGEMYFNGYKINLLPDKTVLGDSSVLSNCTFQDCGAGLHISTGFFSF
ncbi:HNH endonuclease [Salimicrobium salexigens]|uniref:HNH endonuclease n=1 Tax=Salimicrobium salexigens TaxID=908941 RepID=A0ABY1L0A5_9BACI|nr:HNH endonuclease signature motif containing protein [Salimicrobium salexigens]SIT00720.1 HNH endonuclease [Salimicrobium salexigens]